MQQYFRSFVFLWKKTFEVLSSLLVFFFSERISMRQSKVDKLYAGLKDLAEERRGKLDERHRLFQLNREVDDLEQWIAEREVVAGSHELGQDYEHVTASTSGGVSGVQWVAYGRPAVSRSSRHLDSHQRS